AQAKAVKTNIADGLAALEQANARLQKQGGNANKTAFKTDTANNALMDYLTGKGSAQAAYDAFGKLANEAIAFGSLTAQEVATLKVAMGEAKVYVDAMGLMGDNGVGIRIKPGTLNNVEARKWYLENEARIPDLIDRSLLLEQQAKQAFNLRKEYIQDIEERTGMKLPKQQIAELKNALRNRIYKRLTPAESAQHRREFNKQKNNLITEWEEKTGQKWPVYERDIISEKTGEPIRRAGCYYDAHHIIESSFGGDSTWWNIHPARFPDIHQAGIHGTGSPAYRLF
ncbi:MAG: hypothetical protein AAGU75_18055, partial [Bacillota bacterium]